MQKEMDESLSYFKIGSPEPSSAAFTLIGLG